MGAAGRQMRGAQFGLGQAGRLVDLRLGLVVDAGDRGERAQLVAGNLAIRNRHPQHGRVALQIPAVLQPQRLEVVVAEPSSQVALQLVSVLGSPAAHELPIEVCVLVHGLAL